LYVSSHKKLASLGLGYVGPKLWFFSWGDRFEFSKSTVESGWKMHGNLLIQIWSKDYSNMQVFFVSK